MNRLKDIEVEKKIENVFNFVILIYNDNYDIISN